MDIYTARIRYDGKDALDITRKSGGVPGLALAPSWFILGPALNARRSGVLTDEEWERYKAAYQEEMRASYRTQRQAWHAILAMPEVTLVCYCSDFLRCHRSLAADLLVKASLGTAAYRGERPIVAPPQGVLFT